ncbi:MAG: type III-B CRISPR module-associated protein Cmr5 [Desulfotomaculales bacterium]
MSLRRSLEQERASFAWDCIERVKGKAYEKEYSGLAKAAPADIQANGLGQTLAFWRAKGWEKGKPKDGGANAHYQLLEHVSEWVGRRLGLKDIKLLDWTVRRATTEDYRRATAEAMAFLLWLRRFAEAELGGE